MLNRKFLNQLNIEQKTWVEINDDARGTYNINSQINFKTTMLQWCLCDYSVAYVLVKGTITITTAGDTPEARWTDQRAKVLIFKNCALLTNCISEINNTQKNNAKCLDIVIPMYNLIVYIDNYSKITGSYLQLFRDEWNATIRDSE